MISAPALVASGEKMFKSLKLVATETQSAGKSLEHGGESDSSILSAWLLKRKSGTKSRFLSSTNRRLFTLDFGSQILFYKHSENEKRVSQPISFRNIISVGHLTDTIADMVDEADTQAGQQMNVKRADSKTSLASSVRKRMPGFTTPRSLRPPKEQHGFVVETTDKPLELLCSSKAEADQWIAALQQAMLLGNPCKFEQITRSDASTVASSRPTTACSFDSSLANTSCSDMSPTQLPPRSKPLADECVKPLQPETTASVSALLPPKVPKRLQVAKAKPRWPLLSPEEQTQTEAIMPAKGAIQTPENFVAAKANEVTEATDGVIEYSAVGANLENDSEAWGIAQTHTSNQVLPRYHDKSEGLSWQQRLAQLDFSDDEDDYEEEQTVPARNASNPPTAAIATSSEPVTVEYCQPFTADLSDGDEE